MNIKGSITLTLLILAPYPATAATISPNEAAAHVGQNVTVEGVATVHVSRNATFIDIGGKYPHEALSAVIFKKRQTVFGDVTRYDGKVVDVEGSVRMYRGKPEIILYDPSEIRAK